MSSHTLLQLRARGRLIARSAFIVLAVGGTAAPSVVRAQGVGPAPGYPFELRPFAGAYVPTGEQRDLLRDAFIVGGQMSYRIIPALAATGTFAWSPNKDHINRGDPLLDILQYDVGLEARAASWLQGRGWDLTPFAGLGVGGRTYSYRDFDADTRTRVAGYGALGGDIGLGHVGLRFEARDYLSRFTPLTGGGGPDTRNDVTLAAGLTFRF